MQSALLEVMQEHQVTIGHVTHPVPEPFLVMATQNPIESEGTYPLPEAQVDRFMLKILVDYPAHDEELTVVQRSLTAAPELRQALTLDDLIAVQRAALDVYVDPAVISYAVDARRRDARPAGVRRCRDLAGYVAYGASPRGPISLVSAARALALIRGRDYVVAAGPRRARQGRVQAPARAHVPGAGRGRHADTILDAVLGAWPRPRSTSARARRRDARRARAGAATPPGPGPGRSPSALLRALDLTIGRRVEGLLAGDHRSTPARAGSELAQVRPYEPGDDVRRIDWNVTARTAIPHVRVAPRRARARRPGSCSTRPPR